MQISKGRILVLRVFDVADEIDLKKAADLVHALARKPQFVRGGAHIRLPSPPLEMLLSRTFEIAGLASNEILIRLYDVGAMAMTFTLTLPTPMSSDELLVLSAKIQEQDDAVTQEAKKIANELLPSLLPACKIPQIANAFEDYTMFQIAKTSPSVDGQELLRALDIPRLLVGETGALAEAEQKHIIEGAMGYSPQELVVVNWNSAFIFQALEFSDTAELLELAAMQLLELRVYNDVVEQALARLYNELSTRTSLFRSSKYQHLSRNIMRLFVDTMEISDRIDNALQFLGDPYFARIHRTAVTQFNIPRWQKQLRDKLEILRQINEMLVDQIGAQKSLNLEIAIVLLITLEILFAWFKVT